MLPDINIILKWGNTLTHNEIDEMSKIIQLYDPGLPENHLYDTHIKKHNPLFVIAYKTGKIISFQCHSIFYSTSPFFRKPTPIILGGTAYQLTEASKYGLAIKMGNIFMQHCFGRFWFLKKIVMIADTVNPKSLRAVNKIFRGSYPDMYHPVPNKVYSFAKNIMKQYYGEQINVDRYLVMSQAHGYDGLTKITAYWHKMYKTKHAYDQYYLDHNVVLKLGEDYFIGGDSIVSVSYYSPKKLIRQLSSQLIKLVSKNNRKAPNNFWWQQKYKYKEKQLA